jgi:hypothetical protein
VARELLDLIPPSRADDVIHFDASDFEFPTALNLLAQVPPDSRHRVASGIVSAFKAIWSESWGPRLEYLLFAGVATLLECQNVSLLGLQRIFVDEVYREWAVRQVRDPMLHAFWRDEFGNYDERFLREAIAPVQNKVGRLLLTAPTRNILGQVKNRIDARFIMDHGRIFIANLAKGRLGEDKANFLGAILVSQFHAAAMSRADIPEQDRQDFTLILDEFHGFATETFASILSESRKFALGMVLANQYLDQIPEIVRNAVFGNVGTTISFRVGETDAAILSREFGDAYPPAMFTDLPNFQVLMRNSTGLSSSAPFHAKTDPPRGRHYGRKATLIGRSRERYATPRASVEDKITRWLRR